LWPLAVLLRECGVNLVRVIRDVTQRTKAISRHAP